MTVHLADRATPPGPGSPSASLETQRRASSQQRNMPSKLNACLLCAAALAALLRCAPAAPLQDDNPAGEPSGEEGETTSDLLSESGSWGPLIGATDGLRKAFKDEFQLEYDVVQGYRVPSCPAGCPNSNFSKEALLHRLAQGLLLYNVLLKHVEKQYPGHMVPSKARVDGQKLMEEVKGMMKNGDQVTAVTSSQAEQLLKDLDNPDTFQRKMNAHSILLQFRLFLIDCKRQIVKKEMHRGSMAHRG